MLHIDCRLTLPNCLSAVCSLIKLLLAAISSPVTTARLDVLLAHNTVQEICAECVSHRPCARQTMIVRVLS